MGGQPSAPLWNTYYGPDEIQRWTPHCHKTKVGLCLCDELHCEEKYYHCAHFFPGLEGRRILLSGLTITDSSCDYALEKTGNAGFFWGVLKRYPPDSYYCCAGFVEQDGGQYRYYVVMWYEQNCWDDAVANFHVGYALLCGECYHDEVFENDEDEILNQKLLDEDTSNVMELIAWFVELQRVSGRNVLENRCAVTRNALEGVSSWNTHQLLLKIKEFVETTPLNARKLTKKYEEHVQLAFYYSLKQHYEIVDLEGHHNPSKPAVRTDLRFQTPEGFVWIIEFKGPQSNQTAADAIQQIRDNGYYQQDRSDPRFGPDKIMLVGIKFNKQDKVDMLIEPL